MLDYEAKANHEVNLSIRLIKIFPSQRTLALTSNGPFISLIPTLTRSGIVPLYLPISTSSRSCSSASSNVNSFRSVLNSLYMFVVATVFPIHCRPPSPKCIRRRALAFTLGSSHRVGLKMLWSGPHTAGLWWNAWLQTARDVYTDVTRLIERCIAKQQQFCLVKYAPLGESDYPRFLSLLGP